jgi:hypothetical protein
MEEGPAQRLVAVHHHGCRTSKANFDDGSSLGLSVQIDEQAAEARKQRAIERACSETSEKNRKDGSDSSWNHLTRSADLAGLD